MSTTRRTFLATGLKAAVATFTATVVGLNPFRRASADGFCGCSGVVNCFDCDCDRVCNQRESAAFPGFMCSTSAGQVSTIAIIDVFFPKDFGRCYACACGAGILWPQGTCACWVGPL